jgi:peptide/nickel transport system ATP-binding protein
VSAKQVVLDVRELSVSYRARGGELTAALRGVSFDLHEREFFAVVGASGSGKSSLAKALVGLVPARGRVRVAKDGELRELDLAARRRAVQLVFQDPGASLDPRMRVGAALDEVLAAVRGLRSRDERREQALERLASVGLGPEVFDAAPRQLSGGQRQRVAIARALCVDPRVLVCDEVLSALDSPVQAQVLELLAKLRAERGLAVVFVTHDLAVARRCADRVAVLHEGAIVECGQAELFDAPRHAHTRELWAARPRWPGCDDEGRVDDRGKDRVDGR